MKTTERPIIKPYSTPRQAGEYPRGCVAESGFLVSDSSGWRHRHPVIADDVCTGCLQCYLLCPDGCIVRHGRKVAVDYRFCKGCGICAAECRRKAIVMEAEHK